MKRSEMVQELGQFLLHELGIVSIHADTILDFVENAGMKPPQTIFGNKWESEDGEEEVDTRAFWDKESK